MANQIIDPSLAENFGPAMQELTDLQRRFVLAYFEHPNYTQAQLAQLAGYRDSPNSPNQLRVIGNNVAHNEKVIAAINEETSKRLRGSGALGVMGIIKVALNEQHKDHLKACAMLADRTGFHALSEHKVTVDDKRPQTKRELIEAVKNVAKELGLDEDAIKKMTGEDVVEGEFVDVDAAIASEMEGI